MPNISPRLFIYSILIAGLSDRAFGDEGMWLYNAPPLKQLKEKYHFEPTKQWLDHLQKASVGLNSCGSGTTYYRGGRLNPNPHVEPASRQKFSDQPPQYLRDGFDAGAHRAEK